MIIIDELPFRFVEDEGFRKLCNGLQAKFSVPSRSTVASQMVCLTTDTWNSIRNLNYMVLTPHFIDDNWSLHKRCLLQWGIEKILTIIVENSSSNDSAIAYLSKKFKNWDRVVLNGEFLHVRCSAHILNLIVSDALKDMSDSVVKIRNAVRYVRSSPARLKKFKTCVEDEKFLVRVWCVCCSYEVELNLFDVGSC
ncbi:zinc finger BED domain-containing protein RICESLEEPER 2-like [Dorcoceras hygrometricum]|uniref:Zinc finger BED domain-containing protein RICESLEEPER 2-like n=1 Tax=Dorcoceras hygrometricum TaxID=472368 RepID=A0A2Z7CLB2_9LAMI|nr:zinc finger BED domain-containing protein RICESLEEPER 2-like [Dorcoceras hygrometricum]